MTLLPSAALNQHIAILGKTGAGKTVDRESVSNGTDYKRSSRDAYIQRLKARQLVQITGRGELRASEELFS